ncbi:MAG: aminotransferase class I/II-fold pyridoxal phosphate-dependent enzyme [Alphaproteobacteria bacterium]|nr:aminotransferase class I/II-fold pyridoxal phosphate-dependent enzyme [Alphaproteobacteria bacterium]
MKISKRGDIPPFIVMDVMKAAAEHEAAGEGVLHMEVGQPSTPAPKGVVAAAKQALDGDVLGYTLATGIEPLRRRIARHYRDFYGVEIPAERICVTTGSSAGFLLTFLAAFDPGDKVAILRPGYPCYRNILGALDIEAVEVPVGAESRFQPTLDMLEAAGGSALDGLLIASPANPTGSMLREDELRRILDYCRHNSIRYISDEIYHGITYGEAAATAAAFDDTAVVINSFSKYYSMTGWRLGWMVLPEDMLRPVERLAQNLFISAPSLAQHAAVAAFECGEELDGNVNRYARNRELLLAELPKAGLDEFAPADGAFYIYADVRKFTNDALAFCAQMLEQTGIAATPGNDFDPVDGASYIRFSFAGSTEDMAEACRRLRGWLGDS